MWGLAFKANTDDVRESPAHSVVPASWRRARAWSPTTLRPMATTRAALGDRLEYAANEYDALDGADALVVATEWNEFRRPDWARVRAALTQPVVFDGRNLYDPEGMARRGFEYHSVGRPHVPSVESFWPYAR